MSLTGAMSVVSDFNDCNLFAHPPRRRASGARSGAVIVRAGTMLRFRYLAGCEVWFDDQAAPAWDGQDASITA